MSHGSRPTECQRPSLTVRQHYRGHAVVKPIHAKAMPVLLHQDDWEVSGHAKGEASLLLARRTLAHD